MLLAFALSASLLPAQLVVDTTGAGTHRDLQKAIDSAKSGSWIEIRNGTWTAIKIRNKSLTLFVSGVQTSFKGLKRYQRYEPSIEILGSGKETVRLIKIYVPSVSIPAGSVQSIEPAIRAVGCQRLEIHDSTIIAPKPVLAGGNWGLGASALDARLCAECVLVNSQLWASSHTALDVSRPNPGQHDGRPAVEASILFSIGSDFLGGSVRYLKTPSQCPSKLPNRGFGGTGGDALHATVFHNWSSKLTPGTGAIVRCWENLGSVIKGSQAAGRKFSGGTQISYPKISFRSNGIFVGKKWTMAFQSSSRGGVVFIGSSISKLSNGLMFKQQRLLIDLATAFVLPFGSAANSLSLQIPMSNALIGQEIWAQNFDFSSSTLSNPISRTILR